ncbi:hypothetical protein JJB09_03185 [Rhizobium sp. KVB221]|uniref:RapA2 cadherin-like domain-containing protein n=1 Tax=Rhizobium setariae TaxID=2801340 RepID=A0A936YR39_9HYPH|nr:hypothetical protein [Rhizobium setariae]MBL0371022.1 hypothetical protein [Rhizobium setariae]
MSITSSAEILVLGDFLNQSQPIVISRPAVGWIVAWTSWSNPATNSDGFFSQSYNADGSTNGNVVRLLSATLSNESSAALTTSGNIVAAGTMTYDPVGDRGWDVYSQGTPVNTYYTGRQSDSSIAALSDGGWVITWTSDAQDGDGGGIYQQRYTSAGAKSGAENRVNTVTAGGQTNSAVTELSGGGWVVTWTSSGQDGSGIYAQIYGSNGAKIGGERLINATTAGDQTEQAVTRLANGGFLVTWTSPDQDGSGIYGRIYDASGSPVGGEFPVNTSKVGNQYDSDVTQLAGGGFVVTWTDDIKPGSTTPSTDGYWAGVFAQVFNADGSKNGSEIQVNVTTADNQWEPSVAALDDGGWVVAWRAKGNGGYDIYQRVFHVTNDAPTGTDKTIAFANSSQTHNFTLADFGYGDANGNQLESIIITTLPDKGTLTLNNVAVTAGQVIDASEIGFLLFRPTGGTTGKSLGQFTFQVVDDGGTAGGGKNTDQTPNTISFTQPFNEAPAGKDNAFAVNEDGQKTFDTADFGFTDSDGGTLKAIIITTLPATGNLKLNGAAVLPGDVIAAADIGKLVWTPDISSAQAGSDAFTFQVQDNGGKTNGGQDTDQSPNTISFTIGVVNSAPSGTDKTLSLLEDGSYSFTAADFGFSDPDDPAAPNRFAAIKIVDGTYAGSIAFRGQQVHLDDIIAVADLGDLVYTPDKNYNGTGLTLKFAVVDDGGTSNGGQDTDQSPNVLTINVSPVNDAPEGTDAQLTVNEDKTFKFSAGTFGFSDPADDGAHHLSQVVINDIKGKGDFMLGRKVVLEGHTIDAADLASLTFKGDKNGFGDKYASLTFTVYDDGGKKNGGTNADATPNTLVFKLTDVVDTFTGDNGNDKLTGTAGKDILTGKGGDDTLKGMAGPDTFVFRKGDDADIILDFNAKGATHDILDIRTVSAIANFKDLMANHVDTVKGGVEIDGLNGDTITLQGVKLADLDAGDFLI